MTESLIYFEAPIEMAGVIIIWIIIYNLFSSLNIRKVMPWLWIFSAIGVILNIGQSFQIYESYKVDYPPQLPISIIISTIVGIFVYKKYFESKGRIY